LRAQDPRHVSHAPKLTKEMGRIDWTKPAAAVYNQVRGLTPWPGTHSVYNGKMLKILQARVGTEGAGKSKAAPGTVISVDKSAFCVACGQGALAVTHVQPEAGKAMSAQSFLSGYKLAAGSQLD